jgi:hypothetical protein
VEEKCGRKMGSTLGPNRGPRAKVILTHPNFFPFSYRLEPEFKNSEYASHQVGPNEAGSQILAFYGARA